MWIFLFKKCQFFNSRWFRIIEHVSDSLKLLYRFFLCFFLSIRIFIHFFPIFIPNKFALPYQLFAFFSFLPIRCLLFFMHLVQSHHRPLVYYTTIPAPGGGPNHFGRATVHCGTPEFSASRHPACRKWNTDAIPSTKVSHFHFIPCRTIWNIVRTVRMGLDETTWRLRGQDVHQHRIFCSEFYPHIFLQIGCSIVRLWTFQPPAQISKPDLRSDSPLRHTHGRGPIDDLIPSTTGSLSSKKMVSLRLLHT